MHPTPFGIASLCALSLGSSLVAQTRPSDTLELARTCLLARRPDQSPQSFARGCAEDFIARNGYTLAPPAADSGLWASEGIEEDSTWTGVLRRRHNSLQPHAAVVGCDSAGCGASFRSASQPSPCVERMVTMTHSFKGMRMQHQGVAPAPGTKDARECSRSRP